MDRDLFRFQDGLETLKLLVQVDTLHHVILDLEGAVHHRVDESDVQRGSFVITALLVLGLSFLCRFFNQLVDVSLVDVEELEKNLPLLHHRS